MKEYKREVGRFANDKTTTYPPFPKSYFSLQTQAIFNEYESRLRKAKKEARPLENFPESLVLLQLDNTWHDTAEAILNNWIGKIYQITNNDRKRLFMDDIDPENPLEL